MGGAKKSQFGSWAASQVLHDHLIARSREQIIVADVLSCCLQLCACSTVRPNPLTTIHGTDCVRLH